MTRDIKFRAWYENRFYNVLSIYYDNKQNIKMVRLSNGGIVGFDNIVLYEFTGLKDKKDVDIWVGDVVEYGKEQYVVHYNVETLSYDLKDFDGTNQCPLWFLSKCKVVGNVREVNKYD